MPAMFPAAPPSTLPSPSPARAGAFAPLSGEALGEAAHRVLEHVFGYPAFRGEQRQIVETGRQAAGLRPPRLQPRQHRFGARHHRRRQAGGARHRQAVAAVGRAVGDLVEEDEVALPLARPHVVER